MKPNKLFSWFYIDTFAHINYLKFTRLLNLIFIRVYEKEFPGRMRKCALQMVKIEI